MYIQQADLTRGVGRDFVKELTAISVKETHEEGDFLFRRGDPANHAYLLLMGRVNLKMGETGQVVHIVNRPGESFVGRVLWAAMLIPQRQNARSRRSCENFTKRTSESSWKRTRLMGSFSSNALQDC